MKNSDMPAMPQPMVNHDGCVYSTFDNYEGGKQAGLTKREMFAKDAPCIDPLFAMDFAKLNQSDKSLVVVYKTNNAYQLTTKGSMKLLKAWCYAYADLMLEEGE